MEIYPIHITNFKVDGGVMFGVVPKAIWQKKYPADENNLCNWALRSLLVKTEDRIVLIDTGYGDKQDEKFFKHAHLNGGEGLHGALEKAGFTADDITDVVLTHLHADHCGGATGYDKDKDEYYPVFKNATFWISKDQWEWAINPNIREKSAFLKENILPIKDTGRLKLVEENTMICPEMEVRLFYGHTKGQLVPFINYNGKKIVFAADLIPSIAHIPLLFNMAYDIYQMTTIEEKKSMLEEAYENNYILFFQHDIYNECCDLKMTDRGIRADKRFTLSEWKSAE